MEFLRTKQPGYIATGKARPQPGRRPSIFDWLWCALRRSPMPKYRTANGDAGGTCAADCGPPYKAPPTLPPTPTDGGWEPPPIVPSGEQEPDAENGCECEPQGVPGEIHIYPGG